MKKVRMGKAIGYLRERVEWHRLAMGRKDQKKNWEITKKAKYLRRKDEHSLAEPLKAQSVDGETWEKHKQTMRNSENLYK